MPYLTNTKTAPDGSGTDFFEIDLRILTLFHPLRSGLAAFLVKETRSRYGMSSVRYKRRLPLPGEPFSEQKAFCETDQRNGRDQESCPSDIFRFSAEKREHTSAYFTDI
jgi:hypothetical protein